MNAIIANHLFKSFEKGKIKALEDISFEVKQSELFGLIDQMVQENHTF
jgi:ABC-type Na+ transport system ATPase subunit NatA